MGRYTLCPFYIDENKRSISCEDVTRSFDSDQDKRDWMSLFCDSLWEDCEYAKGLLDMYDKIDKGDEMAREEHMQRAKQTEIRALMSKLGRAEKRIEARDIEIAELRKKNKRLEDMRRDTYAQFRKMQSAADEQERKFYRELQKMAQLYEDRLCYMIANYTGGRLTESLVKEWAEDREYLLTYEGEGDDIVWVVREKGDEEDVQETAVE